MFLLNQSENFEFITGIFSPFTFKAMTNIFGIYIYQFYHLYLSPIQCSILFSLLMFFSYQVIGYYQSYQIMLEFLKI